MLRVGVVLMVLLLAAGPAGAHSPPGRVSFVQVRGGHASIWTMNAFGTGLRRLATGSSPAWTLTGTRIAYVRAGAVWVMAGDGSGQRRVVRGGEPSWAPDGRHLVFARAGSLWVVDAAGHGLRRLTAGRSPAWSPDATSIAFERGGAIWTVPAVGGQARLLIRDAGEPAWAQDARRLAFTSRRAHFGTTCDPHCRPSADVYVMDAEGSRLQRVTGTRADEQSPTWSPDGIWLAMASDRADRRRHRYAVWLLSLTPPELIRATVGRADDAEPAWGL